MSDEPIVSDVADVEPAAQDADPNLRIAELEQQLAQTSEAFLRSRAEFQNLKRRTEEEREGLKAYLTSDLLSRFLPILDNLERALGAAASTRDADKLIGGVEAIHKQMGDLLTREGVEPIPAVGETFDPNVHNAVLSEPSAEFAENVVSAELQRGYILSGRVLRPSLVKVSTGD